MISPGYRNPVTTKTCQYGVFDIRCGQPATTKRQRPAMTETWDVCAHHADFLDRLRLNIERHRPLLDRLAEID